MAKADYQRVQQLEAALADLEEQLETPVVPGELLGWCKRTQGAYEALRELYVDRVRPAHRQQLDEMRDEDAEMNPRVAQLAEEDEAIVVELERLRSLLQVIVENVGAKEEGSDETLTHDKRESFVQQALALIIRIRTFEKSLQTWFVEAFQRDRGVVD